ncbi:uncharacterized protein LOC116170241 [Photinus pyralis]|uniref:uncharacterized protein LOC116170241 n=1 Tax=Photinus pyralis TaxID=7054 RepID=UPI0012676120|nr:uncharacterized protein LOC116170241 [Photinus pyralis]
MKSIKSGGGIVVEIKKIWFLAYAVHAVILATEIERMKEMMGMMEGYLERNGLPLPESHTCTQVDRFWQAQTMASSLEFEKWMEEKGRWDNTYYYSLDLSQTCRCLKKGVLKIYIIDKKVPRINSLVNKMKEKIDHVGGKETLRSGVNVLNLFVITLACQDEHVTKKSISYHVNATLKNYKRSRREVKTTNSNAAHFATEKKITTDNPFVGRNNDSDFSWLDDALKDIAYYLRAHKFNEYDRRYEANPNLAPRDYFKEFPRPPLRTLHWEVHKFCEPSFLSCVEYLNRQIRHAGLKRLDDTAVVIQEQGWNYGEHSAQISAVEKDCRKMLKIDDARADPFQGPIERYQWRTTASYYMCWYTMNGVPDLIRINEECDNFANCLEPNFGEHNNDQRANDYLPYSCALYSFCPDPCCPLKHLNNFEMCWDNQENPCFLYNSAGQRQCSLNRSQNVDFGDIVLNRWNVTCQCSHSGYEWNSKYGMCVDIDECSSALHNCNSEREACVNLPGSFRCACRWGFIWNADNKMCEPSSSLEIIRLNNRKEEIVSKDKKASSIVKRLFNMFVPSSSKQITALRV